MKFEQFTLDRQELEMAVRLLDVDGGFAGATIYEGSMSVFKVTSYGELEMTCSHAGIDEQTITFKKTYKS